MEDVERWVDYKCGYCIRLINDTAHEQRPVEWDGERERMKVGRVGQISGGAIWPCIVMDGELNFDRSLSDRLVGPCD